MNPNPLSLPDLDHFLDTVVGWHVTDAGLTRRYIFADFEKALRFVTRVGAVCEAANHFPEMKLGWGFAEITFVAADIDDISQKDLDIAKEVSSLC